MSEEKEGSEFKVPLTTILKVEKHPNADRLSLYTVYGFQVVGGLNQYKEGDLVVYIPVDSILQQNLEDILFPLDSKIKINKHRVRQIRIRKCASQGMLIPIDTVNKIVNVDNFDIDEDISAYLGVTKYEPPCNQKEPSGPKKRNKPLENSRFHKYGGIDNIKWYPSFFENQEVIIQEKLHGSNCRASYSKTEANTFWKKVKKLFGILPKYEYCYGSNNVQLQERSSYTGFYGEDVYGAVLNKVHTFAKLHQGETIYGELIGPGIQKGYDYGHKDHHFVLFDIKIEKEDGSQEYLNPEEAEAYAKERGFDFVPILYRGIFNAVLAKELSMGKSIYNPVEKVREGIVIKARTEYSNCSSKKALKLISEIYLDNPENTDNH